LFANLSRHFTFRHDYGPYEYTTHLYHEPEVSAWPRFVPPAPPGSGLQQPEGK
jgi:hypothetical protein